MWNKGENMFSGIVEKTAKTLDVKKEEKGLRLCIGNPYGELQVGESIALDGACLTVEKFDDKSIQFFLSDETLSRTKFSRISLKEHVFNLERSLTLNKLLGGHIVLGHVDTVGKVRRVSEDEEGRTVEIVFDSEFSRYTVYKGSIAVDGVSLTINDLGEGWISLYLIPHTLQTTNLRYLREGSPVNLEFDILAKYVERLMKRD